MTIVDLYIVISEHFDRELAGYYFRYVLLLCKQCEIRPPNSIYKKTPY